MRWRTPWANSSTGNSPDVRCAGLLRREIKVTVHLNTGASFVHCHRNLHKGFYPSRSKARALKQGPPGALRRGLCPFRTLCPEIRNTRRTMSPVNKLCGDLVSATKFPFENFGHLDIRACGFFTLPARATVAAGMRSAAGRPNSTSARKRMPAATGPNTLSEQPGYQPIFGPSLGSGGPGGGEAL